MAAFVELKSVAKDLYAIGEVPPLGHVPARMHAWAIRKERHGPPQSSMQLEILPTWPIGEDEVLVYVMAGGINYNGIWAALGQPISPLDVHKQPYHIAGSDAAGVVWAIGNKVRRWHVGDEVIVHCNQDDGDDEECNGGDPMFSPSQRIWGYETPDGSFAQFCRVQSRQLMTKPKHLTWEEAASYTLTLATAYRMLFGHPPHTLKPGDNVLVWGASGGLGVFGCRFARLPERTPSASSRTRASANTSWSLAPRASSTARISLLGTDAEGRHRRIRCVGQGGTQVRQGDLGYHRQTRCRLVFEHPGEQTFPTSCLVVKRGGMVVFCAGTTGYNLSFDARYVWMRQKRMQGSHFAHLKQASAANQFVLDRRIDPCMSDVFAWEKIPFAHEMMWKNQHKPGNMAVLVNSPRPGLRNFEDVLEAAGSG